MVPAAPGAAMTGPKHNAEEEDDGSVGPLNLPVIPEQDEGYKGIYNSPDEDDDHEDDLFGDEYPLG